MSGSKSVGDPLRPYNSKKDGWTRRDATHLLWRTQFGASADEIEQATTAGLGKTLDRLLTPQEESPDFETSERLLRQVAVDTGNISHLKAWWLYRMLNSANPLVEKVSLFWHNHFATSNAKVGSVDHIVAQNDLIRREAVGSFRKLLSGMARDVAMLIWLDSNANRKRQPNENFAREVMELFSLGVGNYTEEDIAEAARAFTGWHLRDDKYWFNRRQHDFTQKTLLGKTGSLDGEDVIEICLGQAACPRFLATKLLATFVTPRPDEQDVEQLALRIRAHDFQMTPVLREMFGSELFFSTNVRRSIIKSPLELVLGAYRALGNRPDLQATIGLLASLGQDVFEPPTVKGWEGGRLWIHSASMLLRANFAPALTSSSRYGTIDDPQSVLKSDGRKTQDDVVGYYTELLLSGDVEPASKQRLTEYLKKAEGDRGERSRGLIQLIMSMPEYQLV
ncbi:MAG: DUF1800 domain-containing protein [Planctomycetaceae bacterium]|nr:DUF1800 domain-containing protein [Planctomycetaceae bacterium]MBT6487641.1 DUF1800 domain-containing protein [Planctomycetaceae bacterium]MBT6495091.1 DUF1800 domain-containing protein [Planctomycetaceae bacterium]